MDNAIKRQLSAEDLDVLVGRAFGGEKRIASALELKDGWFNSAYALTFSDGTRSVLKVAPRMEAGMMRYERDVMRAEVDVLHLLKETGSIPVPEVYYYEAEPGGFEFFFMEFLSGEPYNKAKENLTAEERKVIEAELGRLSRRLNEISGKRFGYYAQEEKQGTDWADVFTDMVAGLLADAKDAQVELPASEVEFRSLLEERRVSLNEVTEPRLVHWDLWDGNLFVKEGRITGLIDCERALWGDPLMEYYFRGLFGDNNSAFLSGYGKESFTDAEKERLQLYDLYLALILRIECMYRQYSDTNHHKWATELLKQCWDGLFGERKTK
ncbi:fructosamine-3-kinase [Fontibacillus phaseoli]|uniref:Fructosamine-3-kinase n=1 Tax=Fontibacillus phaseoli TaxID=1416533 RepID=A0A369BSS3_9BACL|nr:aminoglycoside phosphotransferase family protein [Fontibacillus phaseoli]RCX22654.1 fructosamine-3-kinase [Fontibacillus phaseoli]